MELSPTPEQAAIYSAVEQSDHSLMINALAGTGKTSTLEGIAGRLPSSIRVLALAFNTKIAKELKDRFPQHIEIKTLNGLGHSAWGRALGRRIEVDDKKLGRLTSAVLKELDLSRDLWEGVRLLVSSAMNAGLVPSSFPYRGLIPDDEATWAGLDDLGLGPTEYDVARMVLTRSIREGFGQGLEHPIICFDEQAYLSTLFGGNYARYPLVLVDEYQDLSPLNILQVKKSAAKRLIIAGDRFQSIYSFRGADAEAYAKLKALRPEWIELPLTMTFRCPRAIVARQQRHTPGFRTAKAIEGLIAYFVGSDTQGEPNEWSWTQVQALSQSSRPTILCRNNAPLLRLGFKLIRQRVGVEMLGRDIGKGLEALSRKILPQDDLSAEECHSRILDWRTTQISLAQANGQEEKAESINDRAECLLAVLDGARPRTARELRAELKAIFSAEGKGALLSTIHKAKGLEWDLVVLLDPWRVPSRRAIEKGGTALEQELNARYVAETRSKHTLILADLDNFVGAT